MKIAIEKIQHDTQGVLLERKNRFLGLVDIGTEKVYAHIHDSGRLSDLLYPGNEVLLKKISKKERKTNWDIIFAKDRSFWILVNSGYHNKIAKTVIEKGLIPGIQDIEEIRKEPKIENGRLDFLIKDEKGNIWVEIKGCTLKKGNVALFPDAPTKRGQKHLKTLISLNERGEKVVLIFLVFRPDTKCFSINKDIDPLFANIFLSSIFKKIKIYPLQFILEKNTLYLKNILPFCNI